MKNAATTRQNFPESGLFKICPESGLLDAGGRDLRFALQELLFPSASQNGASITYLPSSAGLAANSRAVGIRTKICPKGPADLCPGSRRLIDMHIFKRNRRRIGLASVLGVGLVALGSAGTGMRAYGEGVDLCANKAAVEKALGQTLDAGTPASLGPILPDIAGQEACIFKPAANAKKNASSVTLILSKTSGPKVYGFSLRDAKTDANIADFLLPGTNRTAFFVGQDNGTKLTDYIDGYGLAVSLPKVTLWIEQTDADGDGDNKDRLLKLAAQLVEGPYAKGIPVCDVAGPLATAVFPEFTKSGKVTSIKDYKPKVTKEGCSFQRADDRDSEVTITTSKPGDFTKVLAAVGFANNGTRLVEFDGGGRSGFVRRKPKNDLATIAVNDTTVLDVQLDPPAKGALGKSKARDIAVALAPLLAK
jgi:hypothetical protein